MLPRRARFVLDFIIDEHGARFSHRERNHTGRSRVGLIAGAARSNARLAESRRNGSEPFVWAAKPHVEPVAPDPYVDA
jgi:hypothetical protein